MSFLLPLTESYLADAQFDILAALQSYRSHQGRTTCVNRPSPLLLDLDYGNGDVKGREAIIKVIAGMPQNRPPAPPAPGQPALRPAAGRHQITNIVIKVEGNKATSRSSWFHVGNDNPQRANTIGGFGHYEDDLVKVNGKWFFTKRKIYNEGNANWQYKGTGNPAW